MKKSKNEINSVINGICARMAKKFANIIYCYEYCMMSGVHSIQILTPNLYDTAQFQEFLDEEMYQYALLGVGCNLAFYDGNEGAHFSLSLNGIGCVK